MLAIHGPHGMRCSSIPYPRRGCGGSSPLLTPGTSPVHHHTTRGIRGFPLVMGRLCPWARYPFFLLGAIAGHSMGAVRLCFPMPQDVLTSLCMDFLTLPPVARNGITYDYVLVIVFRLSGFIRAHAFSRKGLTSQRSAEFFLEECVAFYGLPKQIVSNKDNLISSIS